MLILTHFLLTIGW